MNNNLDKGQLAQGAKFDAGKTRIELFPGDALFAISQVLTFGAKKYADRNWEQGISWSRVFGALMRHMWAWWQGRGPTNKSFLFGTLDAETSMSHLWHAGCCLVFLISYEMRGMHSFDDRPIDTRFINKLKPDAFVYGDWDAAAQKNAGQPTKRAGSIPGVREQMDPTPCHKVTRDLLTGMPVVKPHG